jgi:hypothetical protein
MASKNITITTPDGAIYYQHPSELCFPASWTDFVTFFGANYFAHAATVRSTPAEKTRMVFFTSVFCLFFPAFGLSIAMSMVVSCATFAPSDIEKAARAGALVMVVRSREPGNQWEPKGICSIPYAVLSSAYRAALR